MPINKFKTKKYNVLVYGSGAREHALAFKIAQSPFLGKLFLAIPNDGFKNLGEEIIFSNFEDLAKKCVKNSIDLAVIGPELPLSEGIVDILQSQGIKCIGTNKFWTQLESSKKFAKEFMKKHNLPTASYLTLDNTFNTPHPIFQALVPCAEKSPLPQGARVAKVLASFSSPPVIKADGLAAGKGVHISKSFEDAKSCITEFLAGKFGDASKTIIVEERLYGEEISVIALFDGETLLPFIPARDYKRLSDNDKGLNTGGMGAFCPVKLTLTQEKELNQYLKKLETALKSEKADFCGVIYSGLILTDSGIKVLEFNMRFGDPETQVLMMHLKSDILEIFVKMTEKNLSEVNLNWKNGVSVCTVIASEGYPQKPKLGTELKETEKAVKKKGTQIFYAGVNIKNGKMTAAGGRVLSVCKTDSDIETARKNIYKTINEIKFEDKIYRADIGL